MTLWHGRWRERVSLLASEALEGPERAATLAHLAACEACRAEHAQLAALWEAIARDPLRSAEPAVPLAVLVARVQASLDAAGRPSSARAVTAPWMWTAAAAAALAALLLWLPTRGNAPLPQEESPQQVAMPDEMIDRLDRSLARQHAVRYLNQAQAVLVNVSSPPECDRVDARVDVEQEARQSRELLARRALLVELDGEPVRSARPVLEDVDTMLREVAALPACARPRDLETIHREISRRRLLMKIDLMTRELAG
jgi:hypothetical protein